MIFWIASYPKSGNTWLRALISSYYYSKDGMFAKNTIEKIDQFPRKKYFDYFDYNPKIIQDTSRFWISAQKKINEDKNIKFFKTHNAFGELNKHKFTDKENTIGAIYIIRDPRNVITSLKNHYEMNDDEALEWMTNTKQYIYDQRNFKEDGFGSFQFLSSWEINYKSWKLQNQIPLKIVRYEDLLDKTFLVFKEIIEFINKTLNSQKSLNKEKLKNAVRSTSFNNLKTHEKNYGFSEAISSKNKRDKIPFFFLGPENDWKKILNDEQSKKLTNIFEKNLKEFSYIK